MKEAKLVQLIWNGSDGYMLADQHNTEDPEWPIQCAAAKWHYEEFKGQRVVFNRQNVYFGFLAAEMADNEIERDEEGEIIMTDDMYHVGESTWCKAI